MPRTPQSLDTDLATLIRDPNSAMNAAINDVTGVTDAEDAPEVADAATFASLATATTAYNDLLAALRERGVLAPEA